MKLSQTALAALIPALVVSGPAFGLGWPGTLVGLWNPPEDDLATVSGETVRYSSLAVHVRRAGEYTFSVEPFDFEAVLFLYAGRFDPEDPLDALLASGPEITFPLVDGVLYHLVTSAAGPGQTGDFDGSLEGPGAAVTAACFLGDEPYFYDEVPLGAQSLQNGLFCVVVFWRDFDDRTGFGKAVGKRSDDSALFWFFSRDNWELMVKVLDGCRINGYYWVFLAATTNVEFDVEVSSFIDFSGKVYHNPLGMAAPATTDTRAFPCP